MNQVVSKAGSEVILKCLLNESIDVDALPWGPEERVPAGIETIVLADEVLPKKGACINVYDADKEEMEVKHHALDHGIVPVRAEADIKCEVDD